MQNRESCKMLSIGGCKKSLHPQKAPGSIFNEYSIKAEKSNPPFFLFCWTLTNAQTRLAAPSFAENKTRVTLRYNLPHLQCKVFQNHLCRLADSAITVEHSTEEWNLLYLSVSILWIWQNHSAVKSGMGAVVIPILQIFFHGKTELMFVGKDNSVQALCLYCPVKVFYPWIYHRHKWR